MAQERTIISCGIYLFNSESKILLEHPTGHKPNIWTIPKGRVDEGETDYFEVAKRELLEETNIDLNKFNIISKKEFEMVRYRQTNKYLKGFFVKVDSDLYDVNLGCESMVYRDGVPSFPEVDGYKWVTLDEAREVLNEFQMVNINRCLELISEKMKYLVEFKKYK